MLSKWPFTVASDVGGCFRNVWAVSPGKGGRKFLSSARWSVDRASKNSAAWANATSWLVEALKLIVLFVTCCDRSSIIHRPLVEGEQKPWRIVFPQRMTVAVSAENLASQPWSQSTPTEIKDVSPKAGSM